MPVSNDEYLRRSIRNLKAGITGLQQRWAIVRALQRQVAAVQAIAAKEGITEQELSVSTTWKLAMVRTDLPALATTATGRQVGGEGVAADGVGQNFNQSPPDSKNSQYDPLAGEQKSLGGCVAWAGAYTGPNPEENDARVLAEAEKLKSRQEWPGEAVVRILGTCPNPNILKGSLGDGRGVSVWSRGMGNVRVGTEVGCVRVRDGEYRRK